MNLKQDIMALEPGSKEMKNYINGLSQENYAALASTYIIGRSAKWENFKIDTTEYHDFIDECEANQIKVTDKMVDDKFVTLDAKKTQYSLLYEDEMKETREEGIYSHNWLGMKTNIHESIQKGFELIDEIK